MAEASGLSRVDPSDRDPMLATSLGTGELLGEAIDQDVAHITLGIGGSATTDGGRGLVDSLESGRRLDDTDLMIACDVSNPLLGPLGAAAVFGPQKGATPEQVALLDARNAAWADELEAREGRRERDTPGAGAAGGVGFGLLAIQDRFRSFALRPGVDLVMEATDFDARLARADLVITGEGRIDAQTAFGKTALGVARRAQAAGKPCVGVGGSVEPEGIDALAAVGAQAVPVWETPVPLEVALGAGAAPLEACGERLARDWAAATRPKA
jgi:glycerate 2-kinase